MTQIHPFRAIHYDVGKVGDLSQVLTQPYDKISDEQRQEYLRRHPCNAVHLCKEPEMEGDREGADRYARSRGYFDAWLRDQVLVQDPDPAVYPYHQIYKDARGITRIRKGLVVTVDLEAPGEGKVHAHERTLLGPKQDRLRLLRALEATVGQIFMLYADPEGAAMRLLESHTNGPPLLEAKDDFGEMHRVWRVTAPAVIRSLQDLFADRDLIIADGHHRYETAVNYRNEMRLAGMRYAEGASPEQRMVTLINLADEGLTIFPTHRLLHGLKDIHLAEMLARLSEWFSVVEYGFHGPADEVRVRTEWLEDLRIEGFGAHCFGLVVGQIDKYFLLTLREGVAPADLSPTDLRLDVNILHGLILERALGIDRGAQEREENITYARHAAEAVDRVRGGKEQIGFLLNPTRVREVAELASKGDHMPQKSTDFYPKLLTGILCHRFERNG